MLQRWLTPVLLLLTAAALDSVASRLDSAAALSSGPPAAAGLRVVVDPATGQIVDRPTADELGRVGGDPVFSRRRSADELERFDLPHGAQGVVLDGWAHHAMRVERGADGSFRYVCELGDAHGEER